MSGIKSSINKIAEAIKDMPIDIPKVGKEIDFYKDIFNSISRQNGEWEGDDWIKGKIGELNEYITKYRKDGIKYLNWQEMHEVYEKWNLRELLILANRISRFGPAA